MVLTILIMFSFFVSYFFPHSFSSPSLSHKHTYTHTHTSYHLFFCLFFSPSTYSCFSFVFLYQTSTSVLLLTLPPEKVFPLRCPATWSSTSWKQTFILTLRLRRRSAFFLLNFSFPLTYLNVLKRILTCLTFVTYFSLSLSPKEILFSFLLNLPNEWSHFYSPPIVMTIALDWI